MPRRNDLAAFPHLDADLDRVRDLLGPARFEDRPELGVLTDNGPGLSGRLIRPTLTLLSFYLLTDPASPADDRAVRAAAAVELLHLSTLYHDDVIDRADQRRGRPSVDAVWDSRLAVLGGDCVLLASGRMAAELGQHEILALMIAGEQLYEGMVIESADRYVASRDEQSYLDAIDGKTAAVFSVACRMGAMQAGHGQREHEALALFGRLFGRAYQLCDDILDLTSTADEMGKPVNADLPEGIYTLPVIRAAVRDRNLARLLGSSMTSEEATRARQLVIASGTVDQARALAEQIMIEAAEQLATVAVDSRARDAFTAYARSVLDRRNSAPVVSQRSTQMLPAPQEKHWHETIRRERTWLVDTGLVACAAELGHRRWKGRFQLLDAVLPALPLADPARERACVDMAMLALVWDDLFEDSQLNDPQAVTAFRRGLVAALRQDPFTSRRPSALATAWASLWPRLCEGRTVRWRERFLDDLERWFEACEREALHRIDRHIPAVTDYFALRRSTSAFDTGIAILEALLDRELPPKLRVHPVLRRCEQLFLLAAFVENDVVGIDQDEADHVPYNLVRAIQQETGCTRGEAIEQACRQQADYRAQLEAMADYIPTLLRILPGLPDRHKYQALYAALVDGARRVPHSDRHTPTPDFGAPEPDLERLRREIYYPAVATTHTAL
ncbi:polyprenyl synthetase family protein [Nocardia pseudobrasiliensis]|uniref:Heptaprenyl diphosphate synthase n=1 Tax=Nocardia pseudobrasiliensis TaxID=45979 RepID=A0A370HK40_9NOCA|nr:polyprenyl synthetase family protein [Nocardia pseudobrasiliensis]RDI58946.1 heptaprenyl diphosphate synthase [Nocardia pseudobrasiliensis]